MAKDIQSGELQVLPAAEPGAPDPENWDVDLRPADEHPDGIESWLPEKETVTVGYIAGPESANRGEEMVATGPADEVAEVLFRAGYTVDGPTDRRTQ